MSVMFAKIVDSLVIDKLKTTKFDKNQRGKN
jgi:hypothetical protein